MFESVVAAEKFSAVRSKEKPPSVRLNEPVVMPVNCATVRVAVLP